jgi:hypothetical protein
LLFKPVMISLSIDLWQSAEAWDMPTGANPLQPVDSRERCADSTRRSITRRRSL